MGSSGRCFRLYYGIFCCMVAKRYDEDWCYQLVGCFRVVHAIHQCRVQYHCFPTPSQRWRCTSAATLDACEIRPRSHASTQPQAHPILQERVGIAYQLSRPMNSSIRRTLPRVRRPMWSLSRWRQAWTAFTVRPTTIPWCIHAKPVHRTRPGAEGVQRVPLPLNVSTGPDVPLVEHHAPRQGGHVHPQVVGKRFGMAQREHHVQVVRIQTFRQVRQEAGAVGVKVIDGLEPFPSWYCCWNAAACVSSSCHVSTGPPKWLLIACFRHWSPFCPST